MRKHLNILLLAAVAIFSLWCTGGLMRKVDQASVLAGAYDMAQGRMQDPSAYYQYDKTYVLYRVCAGILKLLPEGVDPVAATNIVLALFFWAALTLFTVRFRRTLHPLALLCFLSAPAVLLNTFYVNSSVLSSAFLLLSAIFVFQAGKRGGWMAAIFFALSAGSRADAVLLLPLLIWLITPRSEVEGLISAIREKKSLLRKQADFSKQWKLLTAGISALAAGWILCPAGGASSDPVFNFKMIAGYAVFGFGAAGLLFIVYCGYLAAPVVRKGSGWQERIYQAAGLGALVLPVLFFIPQLHTPRYFWLGCNAVLFMSAAKPSLPEPGRAARVLLMAAALLPLVIGVRLPALSRPQIVAAHSGGFYPTGDGFYPMGGTLPFMFRLKDAAERPVDHNQLIWNAMRQARFEFNENRSINVLSTPMFGYFMLEASLQRGKAERCSPEDVQKGRFYADSRSLMRDDPKSPINKLSEILLLPARFISPVRDGVGILEFGAGTDEWGRQTRMLNRLFGGNEYRIADAAGSGTPDRKTVVFSKQPFAGAVQDDVSGLYYSEEPASVPVPGSFRAVAVFPEWMSIRVFKGRDYKNL
ncbi:MAG TPA: hypothetical protein PLD51_00480 [Pontiellaceae bacterium]|nr:hypothetical protein [Pontiellaceae bacterium]